jgi:hypothetical protein
MRESHKSKSVWLTKDVLERLDRLAPTRGWLADTGRNFGKTNYQEALTEAINAGLAALGIQQEETKP